MSLSANKKKRSHRSKSLSPSPIPNNNNQRTCQYNHSNKLIDSSTASTFQCNDCKSKIKRNGIVYGCFRCKFYLCQPCFSKPSCKNGHLLKRSHAKRNTICCVCKYKSKKQRLQMYQCNVCKFNMCLGCYSYETCSGNHGLKLIKIKQSTDKLLQNCNKCHRIFKINKSLFMCKKCKYSLCLDCYQPLKSQILSLKTQIKEQEEEESKYEYERSVGSNTSKSKKKHKKYTQTQKKSSKKKKTKTKSAQPNNGNTPSLSLSATSSIYIESNNTNYDNELSSSLDLFGIESCAPSEMTRVPSILTDCIICMEREKEVAFIPCGHYITCEKCATLLRNDIGMCAICSMKIQSVLRIYE